MNKKMPISVTIMVKNAEKYLEKCLASLAQFSEIIILDNGSTDSTLDIAKKFDNVVVHYHKFIGFGPMKNLMAELATNDWIINIDSDEVFPSELINEISQLDLTNQHKVYQILRINHYRNTPIKTCGWYPDYVKRLYHRSLVSFNNKQVHESLDIPANIELVTLKNSFNHYSFDNAEGLINKMQQYTTLFAQQQKFSKKSSVGKAISHGISAFIKNYFLKKGITSGSNGFIISMANAMGSYYKYIKLYEANQTLSCSLIITTYNRPDALEAVLNSVLVQESLPDEVIIADDGSTQETIDLVKKYQENFPIPLKHAWQEDNGFRLSRSRNKALSLVKNDYVIIIDGDMVMHPKFISDHKSVAKKGIFIQGSRVVLTTEKTEELLKNKEHYQHLKWYEKGLEKRIEKRFTSIRISFIRDIILSKEKSNYYHGIRGCNMAFFKEDAFAINGFNNDFVGWGREDSEFVARFFNNGGKRANLKFSAIAYHLWHHEASRDSLPENDKLLEDAINQKLKWCKNGVTQIKND